MVDVCRNDRTACRDFLAHKFWSDLGRNALREAAENRRRVFALCTLRRARVLLVETIAQDVVGQVTHLRPTHVFTDRDELHFGSDDALARIPELGNRMPCRGAQRLAAKSRELQQTVALRCAGILGVIARKISVVLRLDFAPLIFLNILPGLNP